MTTISNLPPVPSRGVPSTFSTLFEAFLTALKDTFVGQVNTVAGEMNTVALEAATSAATAQGAAASAQAAATASLAGSSFKGNWSSLSGALNMPASVAHGGRLWLLNANVADVATKTPGVASEWTVMTVKSQDVVDTSSAVAALNIDCALADYFTKTVTGNSTFTVSNVPASGTVASFILNLTNAGAYTITWWSGMKWAGGTAPTLTASGRDVLGFFTYDGGTTWTGLVLTKDAK